MTHEKQPATTGRHGGQGRRLLACDRDAIPAGAHLVTPRRGFLHHGIYIGNGRVIHYAGYSRSGRRGPVEDVSLERFTRGRALWLKPADDARYGGADAVERARSRLGENRYRITSNNCEHFCEWCLRGLERSEQVERLLDWPPLAAVRRIAALVRVPADAQRGRGDPCAA